MLTLRRQDGTQLVGNWSVQVHLGPVQQYSHLSAKFIATGGVRWAD